MIRFQFELSAVEKMFELLTRQEGGKKFPVIGREFLPRCRRLLKPRAAACSPSALGLRLHVSRWHQCSAGLEQLEMDAGG